MFYIQDLIDHFRRDRTEKLNIECDYFTKTIINKTKHLNNNKKVNELVTYVDWSKLYF